MFVLKKLWPMLDRRWSMIAAVGVAVLLAGPSIFTGFTTDDHNFRLVFRGAPGLPEFARAPWEVFSFYADRGPELRQAFLERGLLPWWTGDTFRAAFCRPLSSLSHYLDYRLFGETAWPMHAHSLLLFAALLLSVGALYRRLQGAGAVAGLALLLFALDDARGLNVGWLSGRNALLTSLFSVLTLLAHDRWRRDGWRAGVVAAPLAWALALASGEAGLGAAGMLAAYALTLETAPWRKRILYLLPYAPVFLVWAALYKSHGFGTHGSTGYVDPFDHPGLYLKGLIFHLPVQLFGQFGLPDCVFFNVLPAPLKAGYWLIAVAYVGALGAMLWPVLRAQPVARFWALGMIFALLPAAATLPQDRLLALAGVGGAALIALALERLRGQPQWSRRAALTVLVGIHLVLSPVALVVTSTATWAIERANLQANASLPMTEGNIVIANAPTELMGIGVSVVRSSLEQPVPEHTLLLSAGNGALSIEYVDAHTVLVRTDDYLNTPWANLFRQTSSEPLHAGWTRQLRNVRIEVLEAGAQGGPKTTRFTFSEPLASPWTHWVTWGGDRYVPFELPRPGEAMRLDARPFLPFVMPAFRIEALQAPHEN